MSELTRPACADVQRVKAITKEAKPSCRHRQQRSLHLLSNIIDLLDRLLSLLAHPMLDNRMRILINLDLRLVHSDLVIISEDRGHLLKRLPSGIREQEKDDKAADEGEENEQEVEQIAAGCAE